MDYKPLTPNISLKNHDLQVHFGDAWAEHRWFYNTDNCLFQRKQKRGGYNIVIEFQKSPESTFLFTLTPIFNGKLDSYGAGIGEKRETVKISDPFLPDTLWLQAHEKNPEEGIGWKKELTGDIIGFVPREKKPPTPHHENLF